MNSSGLVPSADPVYNSCTAFSTSTLPISGRRTDQRSSSRLLASKHKHWDNMVNKVSCTQPIVVSVDKSYVWFETKIMIIKVKQWPSFC